MSSTHHRFPDRDCLFHRRIKLFSVLSAVQVLVLLKSAASMYATGQKSEWQDGTPAGYTVQILETINRYSGCGRLPARDQHARHIMYR
jgi:hypothetical protein